MVFLLLFCMSNYNFIEIRSINHLIISNKLKLIITGVITAVSLKPLKPRLCPAQEGRTGLVQFPLALFCDVERSRKGGGYSDGLRLIGQTLVVTICIGLLFGWIVLFKLLNSSIIAMFPNK